jgi:hypothetical protein
VNDERASNHEAVAMAYFKIILKHLCVRTEDSHSYLQSKLRVLLSESEPNMAERYHSIKNIGISPLFITATCRAKNEFGPADTNPFNTEVYVKNT